MVIYTSPNGYELTSEDLAVLAYSSRQWRKSTGDEKRIPAERAVDDILWDLGWFVPSREVGEKV